MTTPFQLYEIKFWCICLLVQEQVKEVHEKTLTTLASEFESSKDYKPTKKDWLASHWTGFYSPAQLSRIRNTGKVGLIVERVLSYFTCPVEV
jgi:2-oxoglutarate dehydrogenase E1 component